MTFINDISNFSQSSNVESNGFWQDKLSYSDFWFSLFWNNRISTINMVFRYKCFLYDFTYERVSGLVYKEHVTSVRCVTSKLLGRNNECMVAHYFKYIVVNSSTAFAIPKAGLTSRFHRLDVPHKRGSKERLMTSSGLKAIYVETNLARRQLNINHYRRQPAPKHRAKNHM